MGEDRSRTVLYCIVLPINKVTFPFRIHTGSFHSCHTVPVLVPRPKQRLFVVVSIIVILHLVSYHIISVVSLFETLQTQTIVALIDLFVSYQYCAVDRSASDVSGTVLRCYVRI